MCGSCPVNTSLDLTLRTCKECTAGDAVIVAVIGTNTNDTCVYMYVCIFMTLMCIVLHTCTNYYCLLLCLFFSHSLVTAFVIASFLVLVFNIGVPNDLKGCFFFVQVCSIVSFANHL